MFKSQRFLRWENGLWRMYYILCIPAWEWKVFRSGHPFLLFVGLSKERKLAEEVLNGLKSKAGHRPPSASTVCLNQIRQCSSSTDFSVDLGLRGVFSDRVKHEFVRPFALADSSDATFWKIDCISLSFHLALPRLDFSVLSSPWCFLVIVLTRCRKIVNHRSRICRCLEQMQMFGAPPSVSMFLVLYCDLTTGDRRVFL